MENSDRYFTLICNCDTEFCPADTRDCPSCKSQVGKSLKLDVDGVLNRIYELYASDKKPDAIDVVFDVFDNLWTRFDLITEILQKADLSKLSTGIMVSILANTFKLSNRLPEHSIFFEKVRKEFLRLGRTEEETDRTLQGLKEEGNHWESMKQLGATGIMWGPRPEDK